MKPYQSITFVYLAFALVWIFVSDRVAEVLVSDIADLGWLQTLKGSLYVLASAILIFLLMRRAYRQQKREEAEKINVFRKTMEGTHHIVNNFLNKMRLVQDEAERCSEFNRDILREAEVMIDQTAHELRDLAELKDISQEEIDRRVYRRGEHSGAGSGTGCKTPTSAGRSHF